MDLASPALDRLSGHGPGSEGGDAAGADDAATPTFGPSASTLAAVFGEASSSLMEAFESAAPSEGCSEEEDDEFFDLQLDIADFLQPATRKQALLALNQQLRDRLRAQLTPKRIMLRDKMAFTLGTLDLFVSAYWLGASPQTFYKLYTVKLVVMMALRWLLYRVQLWHYYLLDFCYWAQLLLLLHTWVYPSSILLAKVTFAFSMGPLLWSILAFRNSLVYHSLDKVTSLFLHLFPACVCVANRWHPLPAMAAALEASPAVAARWERAELWELCLLPMGPYLLWAVLYYVKIFVVSSKKISQRGYETLFSYVTTRRGLFATVVLRFPRQLQPLAYIAMHAALTLCAMGLNSLWWSSKNASVALIMGAFALSAWQGATFYFESFSHKYLLSLGLEPKRHPGRSPKSTSATPPPSAQSKQE